MPKTALKSDKICPIFGLIMKEMFSSFRVNLFCANSRVCILLNTMTQGGGEDMTNMAKMGNSQKLSSLGANKIWKRKGIRWTGLILHPANKPKI